MTLPSSKIKETNAPSLDAESFTEVSVQTERLDDLFSTKNKKLAMKIDIEGHELKALRGMNILLMANQCILQIESFEENFKACRELLEALGYHHLESISDDHYFSNCYGTPATS